MRGMLVGAVASAAVATACTLGVVDLPADPSPAELLVTSQIGADPADPSRVQVIVTARLEPGIGLDGAPRRLTSDVFGVEDTDHAPSPSGDPDRPTWSVTESYPTPGPEALPLRFPRLEGLGRTANINMRVRVDATPGDTIVLAGGEDLVVRTEPPSYPAEALGWSLDLTSSSMPAFRLVTGGVEDWPAEVRVPARQIPADAFPLQATLRVRWDRSLNLFELTAEERYDLALRSIMVVAWTVESAR